MATLNGRLKTSDLTPIPAAFHTHGTVAYLQNDAADAYLRVAYAFEKKFGKRLVAMSFYRPYADQVRIFLRNYTRVGRARKYKTDRSYNRSTYAKRSGKAPVASPGYSNHGLGRTVDFNSGVQTMGSKEHSWMLSEGTKYGWDWTEGKRVGEAWHWGYMRSKDKKRKAPKANTHSAPAPVKIPATGPTIADILQAQKHLLALGYEPGVLDGKLGDKVRAATKNFQKDFGLEADGIPGPDTRKALVNAMSKLDDLEKKIDNLTKAVNTVADTVSPGKAGVRTDGELAKLIRDSRDEIINAVSPGKAGVRHDGELAAFLRAELRAIPTRVLDEPVALKGGKFEGKSSSLRTKVAWLDHERESGEDRVIAACSCKLKEDR